MWGGGAGRRRPVLAAEYGGGLAGATKSSGSDPDSAWERVRQLECGMGDLPRWFAWGRRELDGARGGEGGAARQGCSTRFAGAGVASLRRCGDVCNGVMGMPKTRLVLWYALWGLACRAGETSP